MDSHKKLHLPSPPHSGTYPSPNVPLKRKMSPGTDRGEPSLADLDGATAAGIPESEYKTGRVHCQTCGTSVTFRDEDTGGFTLKHWDDHRLKCGPASSSHVEPPRPSGDIASASIPSSSSPTKRRRAKRTEEERIEYLRADPYVAQFEAYRVLCSSCQKWIRLRPNSTYCSIPWDAHRKSCLSKKVSKNVYALEERTSLFEKDRDVRKFDPERVLCGICSRWLSVSSTDHLQAVQRWLQHRSECQRVFNASGSGLSSDHPKPEDVPQPADQPIPLVSHHSALSSPSIVRSSTPGNRTPSQSTHGPSRCPSPSPLPSFQHDLNPSNFLPSHESRRRNAEQRAANLRADPLIGEVDPNKVFCNLCQKWVQLRQDSSYCAYPWLQHRGKCLSRHQRRVQRAADIAEIKAARKQAFRNDPGVVLEEDLGGADTEEDPESEEDAGTLDDGIVGSRDDAGETELPRAPNPAQPSFHQDWKASAGPSNQSKRIRLSAEEISSHDGGLRGGTVTFAPPAPPNRFVSNVPVRRPRPVGLADLDTTSGRKNFVFAAIDHLFTTTYESTDDMTISALLAYLNAAMPPDKHEDFDTGEVVKAAAALHAKGRIRFEGDMLRKVD